MTVDTFLKKWHGEAGGAERANYQMFLGDFCRALGLPEPEPAGAGMLDDYQYEGPVKSAAALPADHGAPPFLIVADIRRTRATRDAAAVRIAMTVAAAGPGEGRALRVVSRCTVPDLW